MIRVHWRAFAVACVCMSAAALDAAETSALVRASAPVRMTLARTLTGYGSVAAGTGKTINVTLTHAAVVRHLAVAVGSQVKAGELLAEIDTDPTVTQGYAQARNAVDSARGETARLERLLAERLATQSQLAAARKTLADADATLDAQRRLGADQPAASLRAPATGVVMAVSAAPGDRLGPGAVILQIARDGSLRVNLGIEPGESRNIRPGAHVTLTPLFEGMEGFEGRVAQVQGIVNPQTQLVDVLVTIDRPPRTGTLFGLRLKGEVEIDRREAWTVPRLAVLRDAAGVHVFQVVNGHARRIAVERGMESGDRVEIRGDIDAKLRIVHEGNYVLRDGMAVREPVP